MSSKRSRSSNDNGAERIYPALCPHFQIDADLKRAIWESVVDSTLASLVSPDLRIKDDELFCSKCKDYVFSADTDAVLTHATYEKLRRLNSNGQSFEDHQSQSVLVPYGAGLCGLVNLGNTCFMNSILQVVLRLPAVRDYFLQGCHHSGCSSAIRAKSSNAWPNRSNASRYKNVWSRPWTSNASPEITPQSTPEPGLMTATLDVPTCFGCEIELLLTDMFCARSAHTPLMPLHLLQSLWQSSPVLAGYYQQDAQELYNALVNAVHAHICNAVSLSSRAPSPEPTSGSSSSGETGVPFEPSSPSGANQKDGLLACQCIVHRELGGVLRSQLTCETCGNASTRYEPFFELPLDLIGNTDDHVISLEDRFKSFVAPEIIQGVMCSNCAGPRDASKKLSLHVLPPTLVIHLKRFQNAPPSDKPDRSSRLLLGLSTTSGSLHKNDVDMELPLTDINLRRFVSSTQACSCPKEESPRFWGSDSKVSTNENCECFIYDVKAVVEHSGQLAGGHYVSYVRVDDDWFRFNDENVFKADEQMVKSAEAYMLFLSRRSSG